MKLIIGSNPSMKLFTLLAIFSLSAWLQAQQEYGGGFERQFQWTGPLTTSPTGSYMGRDLDVLGDINGDGVADLIACAPNAESPGGGANAGLVEVHSGADGALLFSHQGGTVNAGVGWSVAGAGDVNFDGVPDYAYSSGWISNATVEIRSGANSRVLAFITPIAGNSYDYGLVGAQDLNGDTIPDLLAYGRKGFLSDATVFALSGADGSEIWSRETSNEIAYLNSLASIPDLDGDGVRDCMVGGVTTNPGNDIPEVVLISGASGAILQTWTDPNGTYRGFGVSVASVADVDGDGMADLAIGNPRAVNASGYWGSVFLYSSATFGLLRTIESNELDRDIGSDISSIGDMDGDGIEDIGVASEYSSGIAIFSGQSGERLYSIALNTGSGGRVKGVGDIDGDGNLDLMTSNQTFGQPRTGGVFLYSFSDFMRSNVSSLSASQGGTVQFFMDFPENNFVSQGDLRYRLLFSGSGVSPTLVRGWNVPLSMDSLLNLGVNGNYPPIFINPEGQLDAAGQAVASLVLAPGAAASMIGTTLNFSAMQYEVNSLGHLWVRGPSRAVSLDILP